MAKVKKKKKKLKAKADVIQPRHIEEIGQRNYYDYAVAMIEDRFVVGSVDGVKPVLRRALWATHDLGFHSSHAHEKSAKVVGETLANYHPHGDTACYEAIVTAANSAMPCIDGKGNWGSMLNKDGFAAMRYTNMRLSKYGEKVFFDKFYLPSIEFIPNYDGSKKEPLNLPVTLPNILLNGNFGMGPGVSTRNPAFTLKSVCKVLQLVINDGKGKATVEHCRGLVPVSEYGGYIDTSDKETKKELKTFYRDGIGKFDWWSKRTEPNAKNRVRYWSFAPLPEDLTDKLAKIGDVKGVKFINNDSESTDPYKAAYVVQFAPSCKGKELEKALERVDELFGSSQRMDVKVTDRTLNKMGDGADISLRSTNIPTILTDFLKHRVHIEKVACRHWKERRNERIRYLKLLIKAIDHLDVIIKALKVDDSAAYIAKHIGITVAQANIILDLRVRQLKKLEIKVLKAEIANLKKEIAGYDKRIKKPMPYIAQHIGALYEELKGEAERQERVMK